MSQHRGTDLQPSDPNTTPEPAKAQEAWINTLLQYVFEAGQDFAEVESDGSVEAYAKQTILTKLTEAEQRGILRLASRFRGRAKTNLTGLEMAHKVQLEADKLIKQLGLTPSREQVNDLAKPDSDTKNSPSNPPDEQLKANKEES